MYISFILFSIIFIFLGVIENFIINKRVLYKPNFLLYSEKKNKKKSTPEQVTTRANKDLKEKKRKRPRSKILECLLKEKVEKVEKNSDENQCSNVDKEIREGKRVPRLRVRNTNNHIYASIIDDYKKYVLCSTCSRDATLSKILGTYRRKATNRVINNGRTIKSAWEIGKIIGKKALSKGIFKVRFDRARHPYAGKVEALAEGARAVGLLL
ncbi:apicoplast ribosomal protein L18 precursor, putative [Plasmodium reichenowi]|uniref:Apicoplast ribosomal protein L18, putative n=1 Tax=Plasmodium reichenowi TaxID=5854 RepID=A0A151LPA7_PLARE|nr:apicoplast ribosomal protein L18 precursor, putative [Plasmodium reichenowi]KYO01018.1 apicoplast ribosomal protein L18 precursor, putative [Plasmodium reichenowi]SOV77478.1 apicoplast ribosomal protein L18 precursor, putative [Plasmodium reichenowi]